MLLGFHYPPDISAGAFRAQALVEALARRLPEGSELLVLTTLPNRYTAGRDAVPEVETQAGGKVTIRRLPVAGGAGGMAAQALAFLRYARHANALTRHGSYDLVIATSSRLMTAVLGRWIARRSNARLYQDIRDNFVDNLPHVLPLGAGHLLAPLFARLERWSLEKADCLNLVSRGFGDYFQARYPRLAISWHTNGIDPLFLEASGSVRFPSNPGHRQGQPLRVLYAGNLGAGQGIERILPALAERLAGRVEFRVIGAGGRRQRLCSELSARGLTNVQVENPVPRSRLPAAYAEADVLFLHLNMLPSLEAVLPSKLFEYAATGRPIWAGLSGFPAGFVENEIDNAALFPPGDVEAALDALGRLEICFRPRLRFVARWRRDTIMQAMADDLMALVTDDT
ncbi:glycosyltransferase family 4 protein [Halomonas campisalis]|uniref:glycosyltransferase family 4 protein n=1 Tax=Billgrantia campisalis TaxID=74661 RepID=UPI001EF0F27C|nr:glycosyltransferase family 4 protein [Halomonas campisalis]MDR5862707.1 glycosyltransferase family 4 protein [Halomonas campisalis]